MSVQVYISIHKHMQLSDLNIHFIQSSDWIETFRLSNIPYNTMTKRAKEETFSMLLATNFNPKHCKILNLYHNFINRELLIHWRSLEHSTWQEWLVRNNDKFSSAWEVSVQDENHEASICLHQHTGMNELGPWWLK